MTVRKLYCVNDLSHAEFEWTSQSEFFHKRKYDCEGLVTREWTLPVRESYQGALRCSICGGEAFVAGEPVNGMGEKVVACDFLGRCKDFFKDENLNNLERILEKLDPDDLDATAKRLLGTVSEAPACKALLEKYGLLMRDS